MTSAATVQGEGGTIGLSELTVVIAPEAEGIAVAGSLHSEIESHAKGGKPTTVSVA